MWKMPLARRNQHVVQFILEGNFLSQETLDNILNEKCPKAYFKLAIGEGIEYTQGDASDRI